MQLEGLQSATIKAQHRHADLCSFVATAELRSHWQKIREEAGLTSLDCLCFRAVELRTTFKHHQLVLGHFNIIVVFVGVEAGVEVAVGSEILKP